METNSKNFVSKENSKDAGLSDKPKFGLVIMASGLSKRFGSNKLMEPLLDKTVIEWILETVAGVFDRQIVVTRSMAVRDLCDRLGTDCIFHEQPYRSDTVRIGLSAMMGEIDYCFFTPADQPLIRRETIIDLVEQAKKSEDKIVRPAFKEVVGAPIGFPRKYFDELLNLPEGKGGGFVAKKYLSEMEYVSVKNEYELWDIDTAEDLEKIKKVIKSI